MGDSCHMIQKERKVHKLEKCTCPSKEEISSHCKLVEFIDETTTLHKLTEVACPGQARPGEYV